MMSMKLPADTPAPAAVYHCEGCGDREWNCHAATRLRWWDGKYIDDSNVDWSKTIAEEPPCWKSTKAGWYCHDCLAPVDEGSAFAEGFGIVDLVANSGPTLAEHLRDRQVGVIAEYTRVRFSLVHDCRDFARGLLEVLNGG